jgi:hypothetical protein
MLRNSIESNGCALFVDYKPQCVDSIYQPGSFISIYFEQKYGLII